MSKKLSKAMMGIVMSCLAVGTANAETGYYGGSFAFVDYSEEGIGDDASLNILYGRLGTRFNENFSGEIRAGIGIGDDSVNVLGTDVDLELDTLFGAYVRGGIQASETLYPYVILGYTRGEATASVSGFGSVSDSESDVSFGLGVDFDVSKTLTINFEYMNYLDKGGAEIDGFSIGIATIF
ncbi:MAG: porin family protein [Pseudomonadales bacterium]|nr:porin family protein [Pseudomonadales bacterium]